MVRIAVLLLLLSIPQAVMAQWQPDGVPLCAAAGEQSVPLTAYDGAGGVIVVWHDYRSGASADLYAQRIDASGTPLWNADGVAVCTAINSQQGLGIAPDGQGGLIVAWEDWRGGTTPDIYAQRIDASGAMLWTAGGVVVCGAARVQNATLVVADGSGGAVIAWADRRNDPGHQKEIYAQRIDATGAPRWTPDGVLLISAATDIYPATITGDGDHGAIIVWLGAGANNVYAKRIDGSGTPLWTAGGVALCTASGTEQTPRAVSDGAGGAIVVWQDNGRVAAYCQRVDASGGVLWTVDGVTTSSVAGGGYGPSAISDGVGGVIVAWSDERNSAFSDIYAQRLDPSGSPVWDAAGVPICDATNSQIFQSTRSLASQL